MSLSKQYQNLRTLIVDQFFKETIPNEKIEKSKEKEKSKPNINIIINETNNYSSFPFWVFLPKTSVKNITNIYNGKSESDKPKTEEEKKEEKQFSLIGKVLSGLAFGSLFLLSIYFESKDAIHSKEFQEIQDKVSLINNLEKDNESEKAKWAVFYLRYDSWIKLYKTRISNFYYLKVIGSFGAVGIPLSYFIENSWTKKTSFAFCTLLGCISIAIRYFNLHDYDKEKKELTTGLLELDNLISFVNNEEKLGKQEDAGN